jgi:anion-transporting  ArsA/GET3 family ATPase
MSVSDRLVGKRVCICAGSGGVGKTTTSAAIAMGLAAEGRRVAVVTIDPARRLADALGIDELGSEPRRVDDARLAGHGIDVAEGGELWAMMLDPKRTFDELIERLAPDDKTRDEILANRIYRELSSAVAGSQEFTAVAKLYELDRSGEFDTIVLDTPPSRNALDFLDAPDRLTGFLEGRALRLFLAPSGLAARVVGRGTSVVFSVLRRVTGVDLMEDLSVFFGALSGVLDGFRERAAGVKRLLADPATTFLIITSPEREPVEEAIFFRGKLREAGMPFGGLIVNRVHPLADGGDEVDVEALTAELDGDAALARKVARTLAEFRVLAHRDAAALQRLTGAIGDDDPILVPHLDGDVHDVDGLVAVHRHLFAPAADRAALLEASAF